ncbi:MAG: hypothetical protein JWO36_7120 [Myxococcales bacterium]|nr:hypothetical protein [Myxococcales bacterium]
MTDGKMTRALGATGIGIGLTEMFAPHWLSRTLGVRDRPLLTRAMGAREIASGAAILAGREERGLWARVVGDAIDIGLLGFAFRRSRRRKVVFAVLGVVAAITVLDVLATRRL